MTSEQSLARLQESAENAATADNDQPANNERVLSDIS